MPGRVHLRLQYTPRSSPNWVTRKPIVGTWLSLVERTLGVGEVASSNLVVPTIISNHLASPSNANGNKSGNKKEHIVPVYAVALWLELPTNKAAMES